MTIICLPRRIINGEQHDARTILEKMCRTTLLETATIEEHMQMHLHDYPHHPSPLTPCRATTWDRIRPSRRRVLATSKKQQF